MKHILLRLAAIAAALVLLFYGGLARAQISIGGYPRTWVGGPTGSDGNTVCELSSPCASFAHALSITSDGGEINCAASSDSSSGSAVTITGPVTIDCHGTFDGHLKGAGGNAFVIAAAGAVVTLRGLNIEGFTGDAAPGANPGANGVVIQAAAVVNIEDCVIENFAQNGISVTTLGNTVLNVRNTIIRSGVNGISFTPTGGAVNGSMDHSMIAKMSGSGVATGTNSVFFTVTNSLIVNAAGFGVHSGGSGTVLEVDSSSVSNNHTAFGTSGGIIRISHNLIYDNTTNYSISGGVIATSGDNKVAVNGSTVPNATITQQ